MCDDVEKMSDLKNIKDDLWKYFELHANQRIASFNFFVVFSTVTISGAAAAMSTETPHYEISAALFLMLSFIVFSFRSIDERNRALIEVAENGIIHLDQILAGRIERVINSELVFAFYAERKLATGEDWVGSIFLKKRLKFSEAFRVVFFMAYIISFSGFGWSCYKLLRDF